VTLAQQAASAAALHVLSIALSLPESPISFHPNLCTAGLHWFPQCIRPLGPGGRPDSRHTYPGDSSGHGKWGFVPHQGRTVHPFPLHAYKAGMLIVGPKCQSSTLPVRALRKSLDVAALAQLFRGLLLQEDTQAQTTLPSAKERWYSAAAFVNVDQLLCLSYLFHPCKTSSMTCSAMPLEASVQMLGQTSSHHPM